MAWDKKGEENFFDDIEDLDELDDMSNFEEELLDEEEDFKIPAKWLPLIAIGLILAAAILCTLLWMFTHREKEPKLPENSGDTTLEETLAEEPFEELENSQPVETVSPETEQQPNDGNENQTVQSEAEQTTSDESAQDGGDTAVQEPVSGTADMQFTEVADSVTAKDVTNLRSVPSTLDAENVVSQLQNGQAVSRTGINDSTGWSRLDYNGQTVYAVTQYLTTDLEYKTPVVQGDPNRVNTQDGRVIIFTDCDDNVTPKEYVNLRVEPSTSQGEVTVNCQVSNGTSVHRTGYSPDSGWSRVEYNGTTLYVVSSMVYTVTAEE